MATNTYQENYYFNTSSVGTNNKALSGYDTPKSIDAEYEAKFNAPKKPFSNRDIMNGIPTVPDIPELQAQYENYNKMPDWFNQLQVATPDEIEQWRKMGKMGIAETWARKRKWEMTPFAGSAAETTLAVRNANTLRRLKKGEQPSNVDLDLLSEYLRDVKEMEARGGHTLFGGAADIMMTSLPYALEFAGGLATSAEGVGLAALGKTLTDIGARKAANKALQAASIKALTNEAEKEILKKGVETTAKISTMEAIKHLTPSIVAKETAKALPKAAYTAAKMELTRTPQHFVGALADKQLSTGVYVTDAGDSIFTQSEAPALSIMKALGETTFEAMTETSGWIFKPVTAYVAKPIRKFLPKTFYEGLEKLVQSEFGESASKVFEKYGYNGVIEEMGEELLNRFLCQTFGINGLESYTIDGFLNNVLYADNPEMWAQEALSFGAMSLGGHAVHGGASKAAKAWGNAKHIDNSLNDGTAAEKYTTEQFYLDQGLVKIKGSESLSAQELRKQLEAMAADPADINNIIQNSSENEIRQTLKEIKTEYPSITKTEKDFAAESIAKDLSANRSFRLEDGAVDEEKINKTANVIASALEKISEKTGIDLETLVNEEKPQIFQSDNDGEVIDGVLQRQFQVAPKTSTKEFKEWFGESKVVNEKGKPLVVYHGTRSNFNTFSKEKGGESNSIANIGFWFAQEKGFAERFASDIWYGESENPIVMPVYISLKNPKIFKPVQQNEKMVNSLKEKVGEIEKDIKEKTKEINEIIIEKGFAPASPFREQLKTLQEQLKKAEAEYYDAIYDDPYAQFKNEIYKIDGQTAREANIGGLGMALKNRESVAQYLEQLKEQGYDGIIIQDTEVDYASAQADTNTQYVAFYPEQIKSVDNQGTFDAGNTNIYYQGKDKKSELSLIMATNVKISTINDILNTGSLIAPSFSITEKGQAELKSRKFGDIIFVRNPENIDYSKDNVYDRDIYSPRMPEPVYRFKGAILQKNEFEQLSGFEKAQAQKLIFNGFTPLGNRRYLDYTTENALKVMKKDGLVGGENYNYGFPSFLAKLAKKQKSKTQLKKTAKNSLVDREINDKEYEAMKDEFSNLVNKIDKYSDIVSYHLYEALGDLLYAIKKNNLREINEFIRWDEVPTEIKQELNDFIERAEKLPHSYFEAKPMRTIPLEEFSLVIYPKGELNDTQLKRLADKGIETIEFEEDKIQEVFEELEKEHSPKVYFKKETAHNFDQLLKGTGYQDSVYFAADAARIDAGVEAQVKSEIEAVLKAAPKDKILRKNIRLGSASARLKEVSPKVRDIRISPNYARILDENGSGALLSQLPSLLQNPLAVLKPIANNSNGISVVVEYEKGENARGIAKIDLELKSAGVGDKKTHYYSVKKVKSNYRKADFNNLFREMLTQNKLLKVDKGNTSTLEKYLNKLSIPEKRNTPFKKEFVKGAFIADKNIIELFRTADESTIIHELAHWWLSTIEKYAENTEEMMLDMAEIRKFLGNNGEKFTEQQHEKFARGFEAYIRSGNGRTNRLKRIFEDFKNFLLDIYSSITELGFTEEELPQIEAVFERLLTTENERVKKDVFDRIDDLSDTIQQVKNNQEKELEELENIYNDNKERIERNTKIKEMTQEFLNKAERVASKENPEVKAYKERYKKVTLSILEVATGYPRQFIANTKNWEKIQDKIGNIDDPFSSGEGFQAEWSEFYSDTGVSYDTMETGGNEKLAQQAFDVLADGSFQPPSMQYEEIDRFFGRYEYLINKVKTSKGNQRVAALEAAVSLFADMPAMPDEAAQDVLRMYGELDSHFDAFEEEKKDEFEKRRYPNLPVAVQLGSFLSRKIGELRIYDKEIGYKRAVNKSDSLYSLIKNTDSVFKAKEALRKINSYIIQDIENKQKLLLHKEIQKQVKVGSRLVKTSGIKKGKFDWQTNTVFQKLKELNKFKKNAALKEYLEVIQASPENVALGEGRENYKENSIEIREFKNDFQSNLERKFLEYRANNVNDGNVALMRSLLEDIMTLKFEGIRAKSEEEFAKKTEKFNLENNLIETLEANDEFTKLGTKWIEKTKTLGNWESLLNAIFDKETSEKYSLLYEESQRDVYTRNKVLQLYDAMRKIYGLEEDKGIKKVITTAIDYDNAQQIINLLKGFEEEKHNYVSYTFDQNARGKFIATNIELSKANIMMYYGWSLNPQLKQRLMTEFCPMEEHEGQAEEVLEEMFSILTENDKKVMWEMIRVCDEIYQDTNEIYIRQFGLSLPYTENYLPSKAERVLSEVDMMHESIVRSNNPSFIKQRINCRFIQMAKTTPLEVILPHVNKSANYVEVSERVTFLNKLFKTNILKNKMLEIYGQKDGKELYYMLLNQLSASTYTTNAQGLSLAKDLVDNVSSSIIPASIGGSLKVMFGQLLSVVNYAENMPAGEWTKGFLQALGKPKETVQYMLQAVPYLESRIASNSQNEVLASITNEADRFRNIKNFFTMNTRWGDVYAIALGGKPYYDFLMAKAKEAGMSEEEAKTMAAEAIREFIVHTLRTQQAGMPSSTSQWQKDQSRHFLTRIFFAFRNTEIQFERKVIDANLQLRRGDITKGEWAKKVFIYKIMNPIMFTSWLTNLGLLQLSRALFIGDDPEGELLNLMGDSVLAILLSSCNAYGMAGMLVSAVIQWAFSKLGNKGKYFESAVPVLSDFEQSIGKLFNKKEVTVADWVDAAAFVGETRAGIPARKLINFAGGVGDVAQGETGIGLTRMFGIGRYTATEAWTGEPPEKRK